MNYIEIFEGENQVLGFLKVFYVDLLFSLVLYWGFFMWKYEVREGRLFVIVVRGKIELRVLEFFWVSLRESKNNCVLVC